MQFIMTEKGAFRCQSSVLLLNMILFITGTFIIFVHLYPLFPLLPCWL